jgi:hypothetical protein
MTMLTVTINGKRIEVATVAEARQRVTEHNRGKSSRAWYRRPATNADGNGAIVRDGNMIGFVSFNGRAWQGVEDWKPDHAELTEE